MAKLKPEDLKKIAERMRRQTHLRDGAGRAKITVHMGTCGIQVHDVILTTSGCAGLCSREPMMTVEIKDQAPVKYVDLEQENARKIFLDHVLGGKIVTQFALAVGSERVS
ncbi:MAG: (2Fe-2S) ferredoxin domain-containing protein [Planctomycetota bacterium]|jgi:NADP-reducing hydrogenase subunit HndB